MNNKFFILILMLFVTTAHAQLFVLLNDSYEMTDDVTVSEAFASTNFNGRNLSVRDSAGQTNMTFIQFNLTQLYDISIDPQNPILDAQVGIYLLNNSITATPEELIIRHVFPFPTYNISNNEWNETSMTWNNRPSASQENTTNIQEINFTNSTLQGRFYYFNITEKIREIYLSGNKNASFKIAFDSGGTGTGTLIFASKETGLGFSPRLNITVNLTQGFLTSQCSINDFVFKFTFFDEQTRTQQLSNPSIDMTIEFLNTTTNGVSGNFSFNLNSSTGFNLCSNSTAITNSTYSLVASYRSGGFVERQYYVEDAPTQQQTFSLYSLNETVARLMKYTIFDLANSPIKRSLVFIQRYYIDSNTYSTIGMMRTDDQGKDTIYLQPNTVFYRLIIVRDGQTLASLTPSKVSVDAITQEGTITINIDPENLGQFYSFIEQVSFGCTANATTNITRCELNDASGLAQTSQLLIQKKTAVGSTQICERTETSPSATLICDISGNGTGIFSYQFNVIISGKTYPLVAGYLDNTQASSIYGETGIFVILFLIIIVGGMTVGSPALSMFSSVIILSVGSLLKIVTIQFASIIGLFVIVVILIYKMRGK